MVFTYSLAQEKQKYLDRQNRCLADQSQVRRASAFGWVGDLKTLIIPAANAFGIFTFVNTWNDYLWPLVVLIGARHFIRNIAAGAVKG